MTRSTSRRTQTLLIAILLVSTAVKIFLAISLPIYLDEGGPRLWPLNDEWSHFKYITYLLEERRLPVNEHIYSISDPMAWIFQDFEYAQPPLYYLLNVPLALLPNPVLACRLFSIVMGIFTLILAIDAAARVLRWKDAAAVVTAIAIGFHPIFLRVGSSVSNDNLAWLLSALLFRLWLDDTNLEKKYLYGLLVGAGILTKASFLIWPIFLAGTGVIVLWRTRRADILIRAFTICLIGVVIGGGIFLRNERLYGDWSGVVGGSGEPGLFLLTENFGNFRVFVNHSIRYFFYPIAEEQAPSPQFSTAVILFLVTTFFLRFRSVRELFAHAEGFYYCVAFTALNILLFLHANLTYNFTEARHLFIGLVPGAVLGVAVVVAAIPRKAAAGLVAVVNIIALLRIW